jgi:hypothetical protein
MFPELSKDINDWLSSIGLEPIYVITVVLLIMSFSQLKKIRQWEELESNDKFLAVAAIVLILLALCLSIARFVDSYASPTPR